MMNRFSTNRKPGILKLAIVLGGWIFTMAIEWIGLPWAIGLPQAFGQAASEYRLTERSIVKDAEQIKRVEDSTRWDPTRTAVIVCDVWDYHHSINAVGRLEEMLPSMDKLLRTARQSGSIIIHAPSDCMPYYAEHPARLRAIDAPKVDLPRNIASWNCKTAQEATGEYPLDQSDGGQDDDPQEHQLWADKLMALGRNPDLPWKAQNPAIAIDESKDYISDKGDEVWAILKSKKIEQVIMIGVHTNMCVLGRPFGLRQLASNGVKVVLVRDLTDCMYNPKQWPYVDHFSGNDLIIAYVEQHVCPTISSDQILGGKPVVFSKDTRAKRELLAKGIQGPNDQPAPWVLTQCTGLFEHSFSQGAKRPFVRCSLRIAPEAFSGQVTLSHPRIRKAWLNGHPMELANRQSSLTTFAFDFAHTFGNDDANVLVLEIDASAVSEDPQVNASHSAPIVQGPSGAVTLSGRWQIKSPSDPGDTNLPLPAKFALPPAVYYTLETP
ncbi:MAG: isochorismatase family protein [Planctomycetota bacterium]|nr:isochorismatase family protein [Planctomycetota bacterium]